MRGFAAPKDVYQGQGSPRVRRRDLYIQKRNPILGETVDTVAQSYEPKSLSINVKDEWGNPIDGVDVMVSYNVTGEVYSARTNPLGNAHFPVGLKEYGMYTIKLQDDQKSYAPATFEIQLPVSEDTIPVVLTRSADQASRIRSHIEPHVMDVQTPESGSNNLVYVGLAALGLYLLTR